jgi:hypothetical protein
MAYLVAQLGAYALVGIDRENPILGSLRVRERLLLAIAGPRTLNDPVGELPANLRRPIRAERIDHHDFVAPAQAFEASADFIFLVEADDDGRDLGLNGGLMSRTAHADKR